MRELAIQTFIKKFGGWQNLKPAHLMILEGLLALELEQFNQQGTSLVKDLKLHDHFETEFDGDTLCYARLGVDADYFDNRSAFVIGGWGIEIASWADSFNAIPFCNALINLVIVLDEVL